MPEKLLQKQFQVQIASNKKNIATYFFEKILRFRKIFAQLTLSNKQVVNWYNFGGIFQPQKH